MEYGEDILSVIFLALVAIVIAALVYKLAPGNSKLIVPSFILICVGLWVSYDYILIGRRKAVKKCKRRHRKKAKKVALEIADEAAEPDNTEPPPMNQEENKPEPPVVKKNEKEIDIDMYLHNLNSQYDIQPIHHMMGCATDTQITNRMKYMGLQPQLARDIRTGWNKYSFQPYVEEELRQYADLEWWNSDHLENEL